MNLCEKIVKLRNEKGLSSVQLAKMTGLSRGYLWQLETGGKANPSLDILQKLARALGVTVSELSDSPPPISQFEKLPPGLAEFVRHRGPALGITKTDVEVMRGVHFRGARPDAAEDFELLFLFLKKWVKA